MVNPTSDTTLLAIHHLFQVLVKLKETDPLSRPYLALFEGMRFSLIGGQKQVRTGHVISTDKEIALLILYNVYVLLYPEELLPTLEDVVALLSKVVFDYAVTERSKL